jgi:spermidine synthase
MRRTYILFPSHAPTILVMPLQPDSATTPPAPQVRESAGRLTLEFTPGSVQSEMLLARPDTLTLAYTRAIMCFALFVPRPRHIVMVGLGGGSLVKFCYRHFPHARITVIELRADVIALRDRFGVPPDDTRLTLIHGDACQVMRTLPGPHGPADVLIVDGFDEAGLPPALGSARFYGDCRRAMLDGGVLVQNIFSYDPGYAAMVSRLRLMFDERVCCVDQVAGNNRIVFAVKSAPGAKGVALPRTLRMQRLVACDGGLGCGWFKRLAVNFLICWLESVVNPAKRSAARIF